MTTVIVNGTFDILHPGHIAMLNTARSIGDYLIVCIDTDRRVKELKGNSRPINNQHDRWFMLKNIKSVNDVWFFDSREELIEKIIEKSEMVRNIMISAAIADLERKNNEITGRSATNRVNRLATELVKEFMVGNR